MLVLEKSRFKMKLIFVLTVAIFALVQEGVNGNAPDPDHGFFLAINKPERGRNDPSYIVVSAINTGTVSSAEMIKFSKDNCDFPIPDLQSDICTLSADGGDFGATLRFRRPERMKGGIFGRYGATYTPAVGDSVEGEIFLKPRTRILDTRGIYTEVIYPSAVGETTLSEDSPTYIGVPPSRFSLTTRWFKENEKGKVISPRRELESTEDAGLYTAVRRRRGSRGWVVQVRVVAADCPSDMWWDGTDCQTRTVTCKNGGVPKNGANECTCPPFFVGNDCDRVVDLDPADGDPFVLSVVRPTGNSLRLRCKDLPDGHRQCKCHLFCLGDLYGCECAPGWTGNGCDKPCRKGTYGVGCNQKCPAEASDCDRFFGPQSRV